MKGMAETRHEECGDVISHFYYVLDSWVTAHWLSPCPYAVANWRETIETIADRWWPLPFVTKRLIRMTCFLREIIRW